MSENAAARRDATVAFLPNRLNRQPIIVLGLTANELWITVGVSAGFGALVGTAFAILVRSIAMVPTTILISVSAGVFVGGGFLRRHKRGRPETWLHRQLQWWGCRRFPALASYLGGSDLITRSGYWTTRRTLS